MMFGTPGDYRALDLMKTLGIEGATITSNSKGTQFVCRPTIAKNFKKMLNVSKTYLEFND